MAVTQRSETRARARPPAGARPIRQAPPSATVRTPLGAALPAALWSALLGLAVVSIAVVVGWWAAPDGGTPSALALAAGGQAWLLVNGADLQLADGSLTLTPLGLVLLPALVLWRSAEWAARAADVRSWPDAVRTTGLLAGSYALVGVAVAYGARTAAVTPVVWSAGLACGLVALVAGGYGVLRASGLDRVALAAVSAEGRLVLRAAAVGVTALVAAAGLVLTAALLLRAGGIGDLWAGLQPDPAGGFLLTVLSVALLPNAVAWCAAFLVGPGFAVGAGTVVAPTGVSLGAAPVLPVLGALPTGSPPTAVALLSLLAPITAGALVGVTVARRTRSTPEHAGLLALGAGVLSGFGLGLVAALSAGALGPGRMSDIGPSGVAVGLVAAAELGLVAGVVAWEWRRHAARRSPEKARDRSD